jgi:predicted phage-related endonuclease
MAEAAAVATLGGSTIAAAAGIDPFMSPVRLWLELTGRYTREASEAMRLGKLLEPVIFHELNERGVAAVRTPGVELYDPARPWLVGHPDGLTETREIVEAKATGRPHEELPPWWEAQAQTYMHLAALPRAIVAQLGGLTFTTWVVDYDPHAAGALLALATSFWDYVAADEPPPPSGHRDDRDALVLLHPEAEPGRKVRESREVREARRELRALLAAEKARGERIDYLRAKVTAYMGTAERLLSAEDEPVAHWRNVQQRRLDTAALKRDHPAVYDEYANVTTTRRLTLD